MTYDFAHISAQFQIEGEYLDCLPYGEGHINQTFLLRVRRDGAEKRYILQRINSTLFQDVPRLMENILRVTSFARDEVIRRGGDPLRETMTVIPARDGKPYYFDGNDYFRVYLFIEDAVSFQTVEDPRYFYASAVAFGKFAMLLANFDAHDLYEPLPDFHNTAKRFRDFTDALARDPLGRAKEVQAEIEFVLAREAMTSKITSLLALGDLPTKVTHNDTKLNNVLIDPKTAEPVAVIDLDTIMPGSICYDFGDSIRFGCSTAAEDEPNLEKVHFDTDLFRTYTEGYLWALGDSVTETELEHLSVGAKMMTYECGMRFLTDYLLGDTYFRVKRPGHNLDRARTQFRLVSEMEQATAQMDHAVREIYAQLRHTKA